MNRRNFIQVVAATLAAAAASKWPAIEWPEPVRRAAGRALYVRQQRGSDDNDGLTPDTAKATIGAAMRQCKGNGETIYVMGGGCFDELEPIDFDKDGVVLIGGAS